MKLLEKYKLVIYLLLFFLLNWGGQIIFANEIKQYDTQSYNLKPVYRFWSGKNETHFYTMSEKEKNIVINNYDDYIWKYEGVAFRAEPYMQGCSHSLYPVYRFWSNKNQSHFYTISEKEKNIVINNYPDYVWKYEGIAYCAARGKLEGFNSVYRFWSADNESHFFTITYQEKNLILSKYPSNIWNLEGIAYYAYGNSGRITPEPVGLNCAVTYENCISCTPGTYACRSEPGEQFGFKGWACQNNNPGNIRFSDYRNNLIASEGGIKACGEKGGYMVFKSYYTGKNSLKSYIKAIAKGKHFAYPECGNCSIKYFFSKYAPAGDQNDPNSYSNNVAQRLGVNADTTTINWIVKYKLNEFVNAIQIQEGWFVD